MFNCVRLELRTLQLICVPNWCRLTSFYRGNGKRWANNLESREILKRVMECQVPSPPSGPKALFLWVGKMTLISTYNLSFAVASPTTTQASTFQQRNNIATFQISCLKLVQYIFDCPAQLLHRTNSEIHFRSRTLLARKSQARLNTRYLQYR